MAYIRTQGEKIPEGTCSYSGKIFVLGGGDPRSQAARSCKEVAILVAKSKQTIKTATALKLLHYTSDEEIENKGITLPPPPNSPPRFHLPRFETVALSAEYDMGINRAQNKTKEYKSYDD